MASKAKRLRTRKRANSPKVEKKPIHGCAVLPEDQGWVNSVSHLKTQPNRTPAPRIVSSCRVPRSDVETRLLTAMKTLRSIPDKERRFFIMKSSSPEYVQEYIDAYNSAEEIMPKFRPTPADVSDCLTALSWVRHLDKAAWRLLWWRSFGISYGLIGQYIGRSDETARKRFEEAITDAWIAANGV